MFHGFFSSLARSRYLSFFSFSFNFTLWSAGTAKSTIQQVSFILRITIIIIIIIVLPYFQFLTIFHRVFIQDLAWGKTVIICILCSIYTFGCYFSSPIDCTFLRNWAVPQSAIFYISYRLGLSGILMFLFFYPCLDHNLGSYYYWHGGSFKSPHFFSFCCQLFVYTYIIIVFDWYFIVCWYWHNF